MLEGVPLSILDIGGWGVAVLMGLAFVLAVFRGKLYPASTVREIEKRAEANIALERERANILAEALEKSEGARNLMSISTHDLVLESTKTLAQTMRAVQDAAQRSWEEGGHEHP